MHKNYVEAQKDSCSWQESNCKTFDVTFISYGRGNLIEYSMKIYGNVLFKEYIWFDSK